MLLLEAANIEKYYSDRLIIQFDELKIYTGDRIGIVGRNGSGKTTLLNILSGDIEPDQGFVKQYCGITYIRQFSEEGILASPKALKEFDLSEKVNQKVYSGGERTRIKIANAFSSDTMLLFADEPTSNLDYNGIELLMQKFSRVDTFLLISHDRMLLDNLCNKIIEIEDGKLKIYNGGYSFYKEQSEMERQYAEVEYEKYIAEKRKLEAAIKNRQRKSRSMKKAPRRMGTSEARLHRRLANEKQEKIDNAVNSLKTRLEKLEIKDKPQEVLEIKLDFSLTDPPENKVVVSAEGLNFSYGKKKIFTNASFKVYNKSKTAIWGENGTGKTTLLNLISGRSNRSIYIVPKARIGHFYQGFENLDDNLSVLENVMKDSVQNETVVRTILARLLIAGDEVHKSVKVLSGGERIKVSFAKLFVSNANVLLLDEPTNYLDMKSMEVLENVLRDYEGTVLFVSHDSAFVNAVADRLLILEDHAIKEFNGTLDEYKSSKLKAQKEINDETERIALQMRIAEVIAKFSEPDADKEALEAEYQELLVRLKQK